VKSKNDISIIYLFIYTKELYNIKVDLVDYLKLCPNFNVFVLDIVQWAFTYCLNLLGTFLDRSLFFSHPTLSAPNIEIFLTPIMNEKLNHVILKIMSRFRV